MPTLFSPDVPVTGRDWQRHSVLSSSVGGVADQLLELHREAARCCSPSKGYFAQAGLVDDQHHSMQIAGSVSVTAVTHRHVEDESDRTQQLAYAAWACDGKRLLVAMAAIVSLWPHRGHLHIRFNWTAERGCCLPPIHCSFD